MTLQASFASQTRHNVLRRTTELTWTVAPVVIALAAWQSAALIMAGSPFSLPSPVEVSAAFVDQLVDGRLLEHIGASLGRLAVGVIVSVPMGVLLGVLMAMSARLTRILSPMFGVMNSVSGIAWIPLAMIWFGLGITTITFVLWNTIFFIVLLNTIAGARAVPKVYANAVRTMGGRRKIVVWSVLIPGAMPHVFAGVKSGVAFGWRALIAAEMVVASSGLGFMIFDAAFYHQLDIILMGVLVIGLLWLALDRAVIVPLERFTVARWGTVSLPD